jgi:hypothetical protein
MMAAMNPAPKNRTARALVLSATAAASLALAACGGGDDTSSTTTASIPTGELAPAALATEADSLCTDAYAEIQGRSDFPDFGTDGPQADELEAATPFFDASADAQQQLYDELSQLQPAPSVAAKWKQFLKAFQVGGVEFARDIADGAATGNGDEFFNVALKAQNDLSALAQSASALGMKVCGAQGSSPDQPPV